ncbi:MAG: hypothetical protein H0V10_10020, partial [Geodermatophilaceae bacterium]|nr:hypothetical protein [Geodermatophilaceae bacterium]
PPAERAPPAKRSILKPLLALGLVLVVLSGGVFALWRVSQNQWYVGADGDHVAIFRGMDLSLAGLTLSDVQRTTDLQINDLTPVNQLRVRDGITASDEAGADQILERLRDELLPPCETGTEPTDPGESTTSTTSTTSTESTGSTTSTESTGSTGSPGTTTSQRPGTFPAPETSGGIPSTLPSPTTLPSLSTTQSSTPTNTSEPGTDCREAGD